LHIQYVVDVMQGLEDRGHILYTDNYYTSPEYYLLECAIINAAIVEGYFTPQGEREPEKRL
jgi:hypothetical protein